MIWDATLDGNGLVKACEKTVARFDALLLFVVHAKAARCVVETGRFTLTGRTTTDMARRTYPFVTPIAGRTIVWEGRVSVPIDSGPAGPLVLAGRRSPRCASRAIGFSERVVARGRSARGIAVPGRVAHHRTVVQRRRRSCLRGIASRGSRG